MKPQKFEEKNERIRLAFEQLKKDHPEKLKRQIDVSFCTLMFGLEDVVDSIKRLSRYGYKYIEILGNYGGETSGNHTQVKEIKKALDAYGMKCSGVICSTQSGFTLESKDFFAKQRAQDHIKANVEFCKELGGSYCMVVPSTTDGKKADPDGGDWDRSVRALREIADIFTEYDIKCTIEPIIHFVSPICHSFEEAKRYIQEVNHPGVRHIQGDVEHMMAHEEHIGEAILDAKDYLLNLHLKDTHAQRPIGNGHLDLDTVIRALYLIGFNEEGHFATGEPLPDYYDPVIGYGTLIKHSEETKEILARETIETFREREREILS